MTIERNVCQLDGMNSCGVMGVDVAEGLSAHRPNLISRTCRDSFRILTPNMLSMGTTTVLNAHKKRFGSLLHIFVGKKNKFRPLYSCTKFSTIPAAKMAL